MILRRELRLFAAVRDFGAKPHFAPTASAPFRLFAGIVFRPLAAP